MRIKDYVQAAYETLVAGQELRETLTKLRAYLEARGLTALYPRVLNGLLEKFRRGERMRTVRLIVAREKDAHAALKEAKHRADELGGIDSHVTHIDPTIIGGFIVEHEGKRLDRSYKRVLLDTYRRLTS